MIPNDPLYPSQWHFSLMGNIQKIWDEFSGAGVKVGVYDSGVDYNHTDLIDNYNSSLHVLDNLGNVLDPFPIGNDAHGTACAGLIGAAANNGIGGTGVASGVALTGINIFGGGFGDVTTVTANFLFVVHQAAINFDISSNSWGTTPLFFDGLTGGGFADQLEDEYAFLSASGRNGLGTVITQAAGNDTRDANGDGTNASRFTITVAATEQTGIIANYSNFGSSILVAAPAAAVTTDISGAAGYDPGDYTTSFNGTSAATPVVSGVIALMLEANPSLGWRDVQNILANSASHTGSAFGGPQDVSEHGLWGFNSASGWNGGGMHSQIDYGYGMVNAYNAVRMAEVWGLFGAAQTSANEVSVSSNLNNLGGLAVPDNNPLGVNFNLTVGPDIEIDHVQLVMNFSHTFVGNLKFTLTSAAGTTIIAQLNTNIGTNFNGEWRFGIDSLRGELSAGTWTVNVADVALGNVGVLNTAQLNVFGSSFSADDVHHITDEYLAMKALHAGRGTILDANGGTDWLDMATIAGNIIVNLANASSFSVNAVNWGALGAAADIENVVTGDGNDMITGNSSVNIIHGMRGNDTLNGGIDALSDTLVGGLGNDSYIINSTNDNIVELAGEGTADRAKASVSFVLAAGVNVEFLGTINAALTNLINLTGNEFAQTVTGNAGANVLNGAGGKDVLDGLAGLDTADFSDKTLAVVATLNGAVAVNVTIGGVIEDSIRNIENLIGGSVTDTLTGDGLANVLRGAGGIDVLDGLAGLDTADFSDKTLAVVATLNGAVAVNVTVGGVIEDSIRNIENLIGGSATDTLTGDGLANVLNGGIDVVSDTLAGRLGNDTYIINTSSDLITEFVGGGTADVVKASVSFTLANDDYIETMQTTDAALTTTINLTGNALRQVITGNAGANILNGGVDVVSDTLVGGLGNDTYIINTSSDLITEFAAGGTADVVQASVSFTLASDDYIETMQTTNAELLTAINLTGNSVTQAITGNAGANILNGMFGNDTLTGGLGSDTFLFNTALSAASNRDTITDFDVAADTISLEDSVFAFIGTQGLALAANLFKNLTTGGAVDADDKILFNDVTGAIFYDSDGSGATAAIQFATLTGAPTVDQNDFFVV